MARTVAMQTYPTPATDYMETSASFYLRDGQNTAPMDQGAQQKPERPASPHRERPQQTPQADIEPHNIRELQIAAQLGQDLAGTGSSLLPTSSSEMVVDGAPDQPLRTIMPHPPPEPEPEPTHHQHHQVSEHEHRQDPAGQVHHFGDPDPHHTDQMALAMPMPLDHTSAAHYELGPKKRSKVSRACDECRRKKVKCDAQTDAGNAVCSSCRRSNIPCLFSRIPQKRGPSKGYIKELADRIGSIEQLVQGPGEDRGTKRSFSTMSAGSVTTTPAPSRTVLWSSEPRPLQPAPGAALPDHRYRTPYSPSNLVPRSESPESSPQLPRASAGVRLPDIISPESDTRCEVPTAIFDSYMAAIHPAVPFLPESRERLEAQLAQCPKPLQDAFLEMLSSTVSSYSIRVALPGASDASRAYRNLLDWEVSATSVAPARRQASDLTYIQTLVLLLVEANNRPPNAPGPPMSTVLGTAVSGALARRLHKHTQRPTAERDTASHIDELSRTRTWWALVALDRWHALGAASHTLIHRRDMIAPARLPLLLGEPFYYFLRFTKLLGAAANLCSNLEDPPVSRSPNELEMPEWLHTWLEDARAELPEQLTPVHAPQVHLAHWHARLLTLLLDPDALSLPLASAAQSALAFLLDNPDFVSPFTHHLTGLTALCLLELATVAKRRDEATEALRNMCGFPLPPSAWNGAIRSIVEERLASLASPNPDAAPPSVEKLARDNLHHLADMATARSGGPAPQGRDGEQGDAVGALATLESAPRPYACLGFNPAPMLRMGYLSVIREMMPR